MIDIVLVDDHTLIRQAIARALAQVDGFQVMGEAGTAEQALDLMASRRPHVVLMDISMPGMGGLAGTEVMRRTYPDVSVLILTVHDREDYLFIALRAGAAGYILKEADIEELIEAIQTVQKGNVYVYPSMVPKLVAERLRRAAAGGDGAVALDRLSLREREILRLIAEGLGKSEIARLLFLSPHTVRRHREHIMEKLNLHSRSELIGFAIKRGILAEPK
ncbi:MAG: response regulator transcription factor [Chloroflexi bacterium]|nr:response regulator transcription factor [Chloroflexota bacterium]